jgi:hypothetical protein
MHQTAMMTEMSDAEFKAMLQTYETLDDTLGVLQALSDETRKIIPVMWPNALATLYRSDLPSYRTYQRLRHLSKLTAIRLLELSRRQLQ